MPREHSLTLDILQELLRLVNLLDLLHQDVLGYLSQFSEVLPPGEELNGLAVDEEAGPVEILAGQSNHG